MTEEPTIGEIPGLTFVYKRVQEVSFVSAVAAGTNLTLLSNLITFPFQVIEAKMFFDNDHLNAVWYYFVYGRSRNTWAVAPPTDLNVFGQVSTSRAFVGNGLMRKAKTNLILDDPPYYLKLHVDNTNAFAIVANASLLIGEL